MTSRPEKVLRRQRRKEKKKQARVRRLEANTTSSLILAGGNADFTDLTAGDDRVPQFSLVAYHGGYLDLTSHDLPVVIDLEGMLLPDSGILPMLFNHKHDDVVGQANRIVKANGQLQLSGLVNGTGPRAKEVVDNARRQFSWQASVGAKPLTDAVLIAEGNSLNVNGRQLDGPFYYYPKTRLTETSFVPVGADREPAAALIASADPQGSDQMKFSEWLTAKGFDESALSADGKKFLKAQFEAELKASKAPESDESPTGSGSATMTGTTPLQIQAAGDGASLGQADDIQAMRRRHAAESRRIELIEAAGEQYGNGMVPINASGDYDPDSETTVRGVSHAIEAGWSADRAALALSRAQRPQSTGNGGLNVDNGQFDRNVIEAAMCLSLGLPADIERGNQTVPILATGLDNATRERVLNAAMSERFQGWGLQETMDAVCLLAGQPWTGSRKTEGQWRHYVQCQQMLNASGGSSTISLPGILSNVANKSLLMAYQSVNVRWPRIAKTTSARDFKAMTMYRITLDGGFRKTGPDGKIQHGRIHESSFTNQLDTYGRKLTLNRQMRINDDLSAFQQIPEQMGRGGATALESEVFQLLMANTGSFFSTGNKNLLTGAGSVLGDAGLTAARKNFGHHVDQYGQPILADPHLMLVPTGLMDTADVLLTSRHRITGADQTIGDRNPHLGKIAGGIVDSAYLDNTNIRTPEGSALSGQSSLAWYLFSDPAVLAAMYVSFLNGQQSPIIQSDAGVFDNDGITIEGYFDFGVSFGDPAAATKSAGE